MALDDGVFAIVRDRMEIEVEGATRQQFIAGDLVLIGGQQGSVLRMGDVGGILRQIALLRKDVQARE